MPVATARSSPIQGSWARRSRASPRPPTGGTLPALRPRPDDLGALKLVELRFGEPEQLAQHLAAVLAERGRRPAQPSHVALVAAWGGPQQARHAHPESERPEQDAH